jgi:hypothetical protein
LISDPFIEVDPGFLPMNTLGNLFNAANPTNGTQIETFESGTNLYVYTYATTNGQQWFLNGQENEGGTLSPGTPAWLYNPSSIAFTNIFIGISPVGSQLTNSVFVGTNYLASILPEFGTLSSNLDYNPNVGDVVSLWNPVSQSFFAYTNTVSGWLPSQPSINLGYGFILTTAYTNEWVESLSSCGPWDSFIVTANPLWTDTGLTVSNNATISITASGLWTGGQGWVGPQGLTSNDLPRVLFLTYSVAHHE